MEEFIGELWHKTATRLAANGHREQTVFLRDIEKVAPIFFRALGGNAAMQIAVGQDNSKRGPRQFWQKVAGTHNGIFDALIDHDKLLLPAAINYFPQQELNQDLYWWWLSAAPQFLAAEGAWFTRNVRATQATLQRYPALRSRYRALVAALLDQRDQYRQTCNDKQESVIRQAVLDPDRALDNDADVLYDDARLPVCLWFRFNRSSAYQKQQTTNNNETPNENAKAREGGNVKRQAEQANENPSRSPIVVFFRAESILSWAENLNINRSTDDDDEDNLSAADDLESLSVTQDQSPRKSRIKFDLDLPAAIDDDIPLSEGWTVPEWDYKKQQLIADRCRIVPMQLKTEVNTVYDERLQHVSRQLRRQFQALTPRNETLHHQPDGHEIELDAVVRHFSERRYGHVDASRLYQTVRKRQRDLSCLLLADLSRSTESHINNDQRVIDVIKDALMLFGDALDACRDPFALQGFYSLRRDPVRLYELKRFDEKYGNTVKQRIAALKPGYYTRVGAALRAATQQLQRQHTKQKLLFLLSDGKPNDMDHYEGRFGIEDTRHAVIEARQHGITPFCITIDDKASNYLPYMFGQQHYVVLRKPEQLPHALLQVYRLLTR